VETQWTGDYIANNFRTTFRNQEDRLEYLQRLAREGRLAIFLGAGASFVPPTCLPTWWRLQKEVVQSLAWSVERFYGSSLTTDFVALFNTRQASKETPLPLEFIAEIMARRFPETYFEVLQCLDSDVPNEVHLSLVALAQAGRLKAIVTTNFDRVIEKAFGNAGVPLDVHVTPGDFDNLARKIKTLSSQEMPCQLLKIHGSADQPKTLIDTLAQRKIGFPPSLVASLRYLLHSQHWLFLGYSGADLEADRNYLCLRSEVEKAAGFTWLVQQGTTPSSAVAEVVSLYEKKARIVHGTLPEWLRSLVADLEVSVPIVSDAKKLLDRAESLVVDRARAWAEARGGLWSAIVLSDILQACGYSIQATKLLMSVESQITDSDRNNNAFATFSDSLGCLSRDQGKYEDALSYYRRALKLYQSQEIWGGINTTLHNLAGMFQSQGEWDNALALYKECLAHIPRSADLSGQASSLVGMANIYYFRGKTEEALRCYHDARDLYKKSGD